MIDKIGIRQSFESMFKMVDPNNKYKPAKIALFYHIIGEDMLKSPIMNKLMDIDMRFSFGLCIRSGHGKMPLKSVVRESANKIKRRYNEFTSLQEEQLIGKRWYDKDEKKTKEVRGYFYDNFLVKDDGLPFINSPKFDLARNYTLTALDVYGKNLISKRLVEMDEALKYYGRCSFLYFIQPSERVKVENMSSGLFRRAPILKIELTDEEVMQIINSRMSAEYNPKPKIWLEFLSFICFIRFYYNDIIKAVIKVRINKEVYKLLSKNILLSTMDIVNQNNMLKWAYINALIRMYSVKTYKTYKTEKGTNKEQVWMKLDIIEEDVEKAIKDYRIVYESIKKFVEENEYSSLNKHEKAIVGLLREKEAFDEKTGIRGNEFMEELMKRTKEKMPTLAKHYYNLRDEGKICTVRGQNYSVVWLGR